MPFRYVFAHLLPFFDFLTHRQHIDTESIFAINQAQMAFKQLKTNLSTKPTVQPPPEEPQPTAGASSGAMLHDNIQKLFDYHDPCQRLSHLHEAPVHINPANPEEYFVLTMVKADAWASAMVSFHQFLCCVVTQYS